ncbi:MAG: D-xylose transporter subunit XylF, partial [Anaerolineae bacterium]|nr:D-xylose transporter subunit XylF [Anaerolineae bacterium]
MSRKLSFVVVTILVLVALTTSLFGCCPQPGDGGEATKAPDTGEKIKVGLSFSDFATERWKIEEELMTKLL